MSDHTVSARTRAVLDNPWLWVGLVYACGLVARVIYMFHVPPEQFVSSDMSFYVSLAQKLAGEHGPLDPADVRYPLGYPALIAFLIAEGGSLARVVNLQLIVSALVPPAVGLLAAAAYGRRTAQLAVMFASLYFPFIEYGALFLSEIHFILWLTLSFAALFAAYHARGPAARLALAAAGGVALSVAAAFQSVALPAAFLLAAVEGTALMVALPNADARARAQRLRPWLLRWAVVAIAAAPLLGVQARACTRANAGRFCVTNNKGPSDLLLGHYGRVGTIEWTPPGGGTTRFGSPGA